MIQSSNRGIDMESNEPKRMSFMVDADVREQLKAYAKDKCRNNMTHAVNDILRDKFKRVKK